MIEAMNRLSQVDLGIALYAELDSEKKHFVPVLKKNQSITPIEANNLKKNFNDTRIEPSVLVAITHSSICQSDRRVLLGNKKSLFLEQNKIVLGHEAGGVIIDPGPWSDRFYKGQKVVVLPHLTCGSCEKCHSNMQNLCSNMQHLGFHMNGTLAEVMNFPLQAIYPVKDQLPSEALPLVEPLACVFRSLFILKKNLLELNLKNGVVSIYGGGPIGALMALAIQRHWPNVMVQMIEPNSKRRQSLKDLGICQLVNEHGATNESMLSLIATSDFIATKDALKKSADKSTIMLFSGINIIDQAEDMATYIEQIHRKELNEIYIHPETKNAINLVGSSGYNFDDIGRSSFELERHYGHYKKVQNVVVNGLAACEAQFIRSNRSDVVKFPASAVECLMAPSGISDQQHGDNVSELLKVLIVNESGFSHV